MIPIKLQIKNFLSYGSDTQEVNFEPYSMICLSGKNGHGKSALLDAMTWAIWGQARKINATAKADQGLLRLGQRQMMVIFDFAFNGQLYRIKREYTAAYGKHYAYLDFGIVDEQDAEKATSLTGKTIRETQEKIIAVIGLDYDAFINSAFLRQGQSNEFSKKSPKERKEVLCSILGLDRFEQLKKLALEKIKQFGSKKDSLERIQQRLGQELASLDDINKQFVEVNNAIQQLLHQEIEKNKCLTDAYDSLRVLLQQLQEYRILLFQIEELKKNREHLGTSILEHYAAWKTMHIRLINAQDRSLIEKQRAALMLNMEQEQKKMHILLELKNKQFALKELERSLMLHHQKHYQDLLTTKKAAYDAALVKKNGDMHHIKFLDAKLDELSTKFEKNNQLVIKLATQISTSGALDTIAVREKKFEKRKEFYHYLVSSGNTYTTALNDLIKKKNFSFNNENPSCPLCMQNLSASRKRYLLTEFNKEEVFTTSKIDRIKKLMPELKSYLVKEHEQVTALKAQQQEHALIRMQHEQELKNRAMITHERNLIAAQKKSATEQLGSAEKELDLHHKEMQSIEQECMASLLTHQEYQQVVQEMATIEKKLQELNYSEEEVDALKKSIAMLDQELRDADQLQQERTQQKERLRKIIESMSVYRGYKKQLADLMKQQQAMQPLVEQESVFQQIINKASQEIKDLVQQKESLLHKKGCLAMQQKQLNAFAQEHKENLHQLSILEKEMQDYKDIATALSKDGIQALLIEEAIPEIEQEANDLLARLTDNQAQVFIESLRDLKKGGTKETLDIKISDAAGIRDYEMFSGGEAFRIDFALRIAISKLLARRAGTSLQTLIIDEGFGSQDDEGLMHIMDALYKIQADFEKIIIVSHLPSMKDQFPVHFIVKKGPAGSTIEVFEQG